MDGQDEPIGISGAIGFLGLAWGVRFLKCGDLSPLEGTCSHRASYCFAGERAADSGCGRPADRCRRLGVRQFVAAYCVPRAAVP